MGGCLSSPDVQPAPSPKPSPKPAASQGLSSVDSAAIKDSREFKDSKDHSRELGAGQSLGPLHPAAFSLPSPAGQVPPSTAPATAVLAVSDSSAASSSSSANAAVAQVLRAPDEAGRLRALRSLGLIGAPPRPQFDAITRLVQQVFGTAVAAVSLIDEELHFISRAGDWACGAQRAGSFCDWTLVPETPQLLVVEDASSDPRFSANKFVSGEPHIRFYAGCPLVSTFGGHRYGTLCCFDFQPRSFSAEQLQLLAHFAELAVREIERDLVLGWQQQEVRRLAGDRDEPLHLKRAVDCFSEGVILLDLSSPSAWRLLYANDAFWAAAGMPGAAGLGAPPSDDFWALFEQSTGSGGTEAALTELSRGREFVLTLRPSAPPAASANASTADASSSTDQGPAPLTVLFRPAGAAEQLRAGMPHAGVPAWVGSGAASGEEEEDSDDDVPVLRQGRSGLQLAAAGVEEDGQQAAAVTTAASQGQQAPRYFFGIVQQQESSTDGEGEERGAGLPGRSASPSDSQAGRSASSPAPSPDLHSPSLTPTTLTGTEGESLEATSMRATDLSSAVIPAFFQMRPEVLSEVTLGPLIGTGSSGRCYRALWQGGRVCVKVIDSWFAAGESQPSLSPSGLQLGPQAALIEGVLLRSLSHPHIISCFTHAVSTQEYPERGRTHQQVWIVQEFANRGSLLEAVDRGLLALPAAGGPNVAAVLAAAQEIAGALCYLHSHDVIHGDLTASNVLLVGSTKDSRRWVCKVADFGLAKHVSGEGITQTAAFGTVTHMPPELLASGNLTKSADVFSFGIILLEMWHGRRAWLGENPMHVFAQASSGALPFAIPTDAPPALASLMRRCLDLEPSRRPTFSDILLEVQSLSRQLSSPPGSGSGGGRRPSAAAGGGSQALPRAASQRRAPAGSGAARLAAAAPAGQASSQPASAFATSGEDDSGQERSVHLPSGSLSSAAGLPSDPASASVASPSRSSGEWVIRRGTSVKAPAWDTLSPRGSLMVSPFAMAAPAALQQGRSS